MDLNSRELALVCWLGISLAATLFTTTARPPLFALARAMLHPKIVDVIGLAAFYVAGCVWVLARCLVWDWPNLKTTFLWFATTAVVAMASTKKLELGSSALKALVREAVTITAVVIFIGSIYTLPFWAEFLLLPLLVMVTAMVAMAERQPEHRIVIGPLNAILSLAGLWIIGYSIYCIATEWRALDFTFQAREFAIPIALTVMFLPFLYGLILYIGFEKATVRLQFKVDDKALRRYIWWRGAFAFGTSTEKFLRFVHAIQMSVVADRAGVDTILITLRQSMEREKSPPPVDWCDGWSPYAAIEFLADQGLRPHHYHSTTIDWSADSPHLKLTDDALPNHLVYRIAGTQTAATELTLELNALHSNECEQCDERFWIAASALVHKSLGDAAVAAFDRAMSTDDPVTINIDHVTIEFERDRWELGERSGHSRSLTVRHSAHRDALSGLS